MVQNFSERIFIYIKIVDKCSDISPLSFAVNLSNGDAAIRHENGKQVARWNVDIASLSNGAATAAAAVSAAAAAAAAAAASASSDEVTTIPEFSDV